MIRLYKILRSERERKGYKLWFNLMAHEINDKFFFISNIHWESMCTKRIKKRNFQTITKAVVWQLCLCVSNGMHARNRRQRRPRQRKQRPSKNWTNKRQRCSRYKDKIWNYDFFFSVRAFQIAQYWFNLRNNIEFAKGNFLLEWNLRKLFRFWLPFVRALVWILCSCLDTHIVFGYNVLDRKSKSQKCRV